MTLDGEGPHARDASGGWQALTPRAVGRVFAPAQFPWWIAGGWAIDLFVGRRTRDHDDIDIGIFRADQASLRMQLREWQIHVASGGSTTPWQGERLDPPINDLWVRPSEDEPWCMQLMLNCGSRDEWIYRRDSEVRLPLSSAVRTDRELPYLAPAVQLLFKAKDSRPKDDRDFRVVWPMLAPEEMTWLNTQLAEHHPGHPWLAEMR